MELELTGCTVLIGPAARFGLPADAPIVPFKVGELFENSGRGASGPYYKISSAVLKKAKLQGEAAGLSFDGTHSIHHSMPNRMSI